MTHPTQLYRAYSNASQTVAKTRQIIMVYDGAIRFLQQARQAMVDKKVEERYQLLVRVSEIIIGLQGCLDFERGGEVARTLYGYYSQIDGKLFTLQHTNSLEECDALIDSLKEMRASWMEVDAQGAAEPVAERPTAEAEPRPLPEGVTISA